MPPPAPDLANRPKQRFKRNRWAPGSDLYPYLASFLTFAPAGYLISLIQTKPWPWFAASLITLFSGFMSLGWALVIANFRRLWWGLIPLNLAPFFVPEYMFRVMQTTGMLEIGAGLSDMANRIIAAVLTVVMVSIGWTLMVRFLVQSESRTARLKTELDLASKIHNSLVPPIELRTPFVEVYGRSEASSEMGGDLIDLAARADSLDLYLADVSGHGVRAGVLMAMVKSAIRTRLLDGSADDHSLDHVATTLNRVVAQVCEPDMFATFSCLRIGADRRVEFALAGHLPILHYIAAEGRIVEHENLSLPLGVDTTETFPSRCVRAGPGDLFALITDGLMEAANRGGEQFGLARLKTVISQCASLPLPDLYRELVTKVREFGAQTDDQTLLLIRVV